MKVVHLKKDSSEDNIEQQIKQLETDIKYHPGNEKAHNRLMILYRRQGDYKQELKTIKRAIKIFEEIFRKRQPAFNNKIRSLSRTIAKVTGLSDQKGNSLFQKGELVKWNKRKEIVTKKIK